MSGEAPVPLWNNFLSNTAYGDFPSGILITLIVLILLSGFFSASETAFSCANKIKLRTLAGNGNNKAKRVLSLTEDNFDKFISTVLIGNNIVNLTASALSVLFFQKLLPINANYSLVATVFITVAVLIFGEITPKFIAKVYSEKLALFFYPLIICFYFVLYPLNLLFGGYKKLVTAIFKIKDEDKTTEEEIMTVALQAEEDGTIRKEETKLIRSVIEFDDLEVGDVFVPRVNVVGIEENASMEEIRKTFEKEGYSRIPVYRNSIDTVIGTIHEKDFFSQYLKGKQSITDIIQPAFYTTEHAELGKLLKQLQKNKTHLAVVLDEYGGTLGIVTLEDILEEIVGEIWDEHDEEINYYKKLSENCFAVDGNAPLSDAFEYFSLPPETAEEEFEASTVSGWAIEVLGEIPRVGTKFDYKNLTVEIAKATVKRVLQVKITVSNEKEEE